MTELDRVQTRLHNLQSVQPILGAMRTISLASWQAAQKQQATTQQYYQALSQAVPWLLPHLPNQPINPERETQSGEKRLVIAIGTERGLCGRFNFEVFGVLKSLLATRSVVSVIILGSRLQRLLQPQPATLTVKALPKNLLDLKQVAFALTAQFLTCYETEMIDRVDIIYNTYRSLGSYETTLKQVVPPQLSGSGDHPPSDSWPPPIIETDPLQLLTQIMTQTIALSVYDCLLASAVAEHATRYQRMEAATQNATRLIDELNISLQAARRQAITQEVQTLAAGAGLANKK